MTPQKKTAENFAKNHHRPEFLAARIFHQRVGVVVIDGLEKLPHLETDRDLR